MRALAIGLCFFLQLVFAQENGAFRVSWDCLMPEEKVICLRPSGLVQGGLGYSSPPGSSEIGWALGARLQVQTQQAGVRYQADFGLWYQAMLQWGLLEAFVEQDLGALWLSLGKRRDYSGPWDDTLMGRDGRWGVFTRYSPSELPWLGLELAYLPHAGLAGGQGFVGGRVDILQVGALLEMVQAPNDLGDLEPSIRLVPRLGLQGAQMGLFWQWDRGFWGTFSLPLPLGQALALVLQCPCEAEAQAWVEALDQSRLEGLLWWNPVWDYLGENSPFLPEERFQAWLSAPRKLLLGLAYSWNNQLRLAVDLSRAPVEAVRVYGQFYWR
ncbi:hypothetical protein Mrub_2274 [Meiothermus ruber DSM 1279]|jgi:hypothetical protein|uniref:DUF3187 family protein n=1 Tax=Meiothermus ruber (strain ATCC 35948 / DSM 1279 / VKM B-1258 / 21) TaxID=504728 RepID=D3PL03_MEIRD|nr:hypothetical protein Mrub_2274 [Meiothermus ruber DSM 1279]AGK05523.1 hypothetical protein K649_11165 [Meiothermus ruber DSM 1279]MCL6528641.1 hypothetical protein [Meiothermus ruber]GAO75946.1 putative uncharacterized protein [Meiothermus ruber H328]